MGKIAVVTPVFNGEKSISKSIASLMAQSYKNWVSIIVNDGSTDQTKKILDALEDERFFVIHLEKNQGRAHARQVAFEKAKALNATYMCMLDADDWYYPNKLSFQFEYMEVNKEIALLSTSLGIINLKDELVRKIASFKTHKVIDASKEGYRTVPHGSSMLRLAEINDVAYDLDLQFGEDQDFMRRILKGKKYAFIPKITYIYSREASFSIKKYGKSLHYNTIIFSKQTTSRIQIFLKEIKNRIKFFVVLVLFSVGASNLYFNWVTQKPSDKEFEEYKDFKQMLH